MSSYPQESSSKRSVDEFRKLSHTASKAERQTSKRSIPRFPASAFILRRADPSTEYEQVSPLGIGSFGTVYKCRSIENGQFYAIKTVAEDDRHKEENIAREIGFLNHCSSEFVSGFYDAFFFNGKLSMILEFFDSGSVHDVMKMAKVKMPETFIFEVVGQCLLALDFLESRKVMHRDIKSGNLLLSTDGCTKLCDFGVSRLFNQNETYTKTIIGTPFWMAPEIVAQTGYSYNADIWSLGISMIEMKDGNPPLSHISAIRAMYVASRRAPPTFRRPARVSKELKELLAKLLIKEDKKRPHASTLLEDPQVKPIIEQLEQASPRYSSSIVKKVVETNLDKVIEFRKKTKFNDGSEEEEEEDSDQDGSVLFIGKKSKSKAKINKAVKQESLIQLNGGVDKLRNSTEDEDETSEGEEVESLLQVDNPTMDSDIESLIFVAIEPVDEEFIDDGGVVVQVSDEEEPDDEEAPIDNKRLSRRKITLRGKNFKSSFVVKSSRVKYEAEADKSDTKMMRKRDKDAGTRIFDPNLKEISRFHAQRKQFIQQKNTDLRYAIQKYRKQCVDVDEAVASKFL